MADFFPQLNEFQWRGIGVPVIATRLTLRQDLAIHRFVGRAGADIEGTGRAPIEISAQIPFYNDIDPGPRESWNRGDLYPDQWRRFLSAMADKSAGDLQHPELGTIKCRPHLCETDWESRTRGGVPVHATWLETTESGDTLQKLISEASPLAGAIQAAADIDRNIVKITLPDWVKKLGVANPTFGDAMLQLQGVFDQATLLSKRVGGTIDSLEYRINAVASAMDRAANEPGAQVQHVKNWPLRDAIERMKSSLHDLRGVIATGSKAVGIYMPGTAGTMAQMAIQIPAPISDLMSLNPSLLRNPIIPAHSRVRYYLA